MKLPKYLDYKALSDKEAEIDIEGVITSELWDDTDTSASQFRDLLKQIGDAKTINLHINSPGGDVFEGVSIYNMLKQSKSKINIYVDGLAASIASVIAMAGDTIYMPENSMMMIHNPWTGAQGNAKELRKLADDLDKMGEAIKTSYMSKSNGKIDEDTLSELMDQETWLTAKEAVDYGLADEVLEPVQMAACLTEKEAKKFKHAPKALVTANPVDEQKAEQTKEEPEENWREEARLLAQRSLDCLNDSLLD